MCSFCGWSVYSELHCTYLVRFFYFFFLFSLRIFPPVCETALVSIAFLMCFCMFLDADLFCLQAVRTICIMITACFFYGLFF